MLQPEGRFDSNAAESRFSNPYDTDMKPAHAYAERTKNLSRPVALLALATLSWADLTLAQESEAGGGNTQASGPFRIGASRSADGGSSFGYSGSPSSTDTRIRTIDAAGDSAGGTGGTSDPGTGFEGASFVAPSFYGRGAQLVTPGRGEFARPRFRYGISVGVGYDDNPNQIATGGLAPVATPREGSGFTWVNGHWDALWLKPKTVFTINVEGGANIFWDRPGNDVDFNMRLGSMYVHKFDPRNQLSANFSFAYLAQPDYSNLYASLNPVGGDYFTLSTKTDYLHRWTQHFATNTSVSANLLQFVDSTQSTLSNNFWDIIFGNEFRFITSPRHTWVVEGRYSLQEYYDNTSLNSQTALFLGGLDWLWTRRLTANFRAGVGYRTFDAGGDFASPYVETSLNYLASRTSSLVVNARYGYEQTNTAGDENLSYRLGILYQRAFTSRFAGNVGFNFIHADFNSVAGGRATSDVYDINLGLQYRFDRHFSIGTRYSYTLQDTSAGTQDFDRHRILFSGQYEY